MLPYKGKKQWYTGAGVVGIIQSREYAIHKVSMGNENFCGKKIEHDFLKFIVKFIQGRRCNSRVRRPSMAVCSPSIRGRLLGHTKAVHGCVAHWDAGAR